MKSVFIFFIHIKTLTKMEVDHQNNADQDWYIDRRAITAERIRNVCMDGDIQIAKHMLETKPHLRASLFANSNIVFRTACEKGFYHIVEWLYELNPNMDMSSNSNDAFIRACTSGHMNIVHFLKTYNPRLNMCVKNNIAFRIACANGNLELAKFIADNNIALSVNAHDNEAFRNACKNGHFDVVTWLVGDPRFGYIVNICDRNNEAFCMACANGHMRIAMWLVIYFGDVTLITANDNKALRLACTNGHTNIVIWLTQHSNFVDASVKNEEAFRKACAGGHTDIASIIFHYNPRLNIFAHQNEARNISVILGNESIIRLLDDIQDIQRVVRAHNVSNLDYYIDNNPNLRQIKETVITTFMGIADMFPPMQLHLTDQLIDAGIINNADNNDMVVETPWARILAPMRFPLGMGRINIEDEDYSDEDEVIFNRNVPKKRVFAPCKNSRVEYNPTECPICYDNKITIITECGHSFCKECIIKYLDKKRTPRHNKDTCPMCRQNITFYHV